MTKQKTETAANEWSTSNVRVNAVAPGWIASSGMDQYPPEMHARIRNMKSMSPLGRIGSESEVSAAIVFLLSEAAAFISGATLRIDGAVIKADQPASSSPDSSLTCTKLLPCVSQDRLPLPNVPSETSTNATPRSTSLRAMRQPCPKRPRP